MFLDGAFKWDTFYPCSSRGCQATRHLSWRYRKKSGTRTRAKLQWWRADRAAEFFFSQADLQLWHSAVLQSLELQECIVARWQLWNFIVRQVKFNMFLHPNEPPRRIFWFIVRKLEAEPSKIGHSFTKYFFWIWMKLKTILIKYALLI